jgi:SAM-dependent methyltransferase
MNWDQPYVASRTIAIWPRQYNDFRIAVAASRLSDRYTDLDARALQLLSYFTTISTPRAAYRSLQDQMGVSEPDFASAVDSLIAGGLLVRHGEATEVQPAASPQEEFQFENLMIHQIMLRDYPRVMAYRSAIFNHARGTTALEIGCGTGVLSVFLAQAGARKVYAIEESPIIETAKRIVQANGYADVVEFYRGSSLDVEIPERVDVIVHELFGVDPFEEALLRSIDDARQRFLEPGGRLIPGRLEVCCFGIESPLWADLNDAVLEAQAFEGSYGIHLAPYIHGLRECLQPARRMLDRLPAAPLPAGVRGSEWLAPSPGILTDEVRLFDIDFAESLSGITDDPKAAILKANKSGLLNAVVVFFRAFMDETIHLSTSPFAPQTHWGSWVWDLRTPVAVRPGDEVHIRATVLTLNGQDRLQIDQVHTSV